MGFRPSLHGSYPEPPMSALGQKQTSRQVQPVSALPPKSTSIATAIPRGVNGSGGRLLKPSRFMAAKDH
jgi:hypothetical protein